MILVTILLQIFAYIFLFVLADEVSNTKCIEIQMGDRFADGWSGAHLVVYPSIGKYLSYTVVCGEANVVKEFFCFDLNIHKNGDFVVLGIVGYKPSYPWEIFWQVLNEDDGHMYTGTYDTSMAFTFEVSVTDDGLKTGRVKLSESRALVPKVIKCQSCVDTSREPAAIVSAALVIPNSISNPLSALPIREPKPTKNGIPLPPILTDSEQAHNGFQSTNGNTISVLDSETTSVATYKSPVSRSDSNSLTSIGSFVSSDNDDREVPILVHPSIRPEIIHSDIAPNLIVPPSLRAILGNRMLQEPPPPLGLQVMLELGHYSTTGGVWFQKDGLGASFSVSGSLGTRLIYSGTVCGLPLEDGHCSVPVREHEKYTWRVGSAFGGDESAIGWTFCGVSGFSSTQLSFSFENGRCVPDTYRELQAICRLKESDQEKGKTSSTVAVQGSIEIVGGSAEGLKLTSEEALVFQKALGDEFADAGFGDMLRHNSASIVNIQSIGSRALAEVSLTTTQVLSFTLHLTADVLGEDTQIHELKAYLDRSFTSGLFAARIRSLARIGEVSSLSSVHRVSLLELSFLHELLGQRAISAIASGTLAIFLLSGLSLFALLLVYLKKRSRYILYSMAADSSMHPSAISPDQFWDMSPKYAPTTEMVVI